MRILTLDRFAPQLGQVRRRIREVLRLPGALTDVGDHLARAPGKLLRPALLLSAEVVGAIDRRVIEAAVAMELVHVASLVHDDLVDQADERRGLPSVRAAWGDGVTVLTGDYLLALACRLLARLGSAALVTEAATAMMAMSQAELGYQYRLHDLTVTAEQYLRYVRGKTASLMEASCRIGAMLADDRGRAADCLGRFGSSLGIAYQLVDDLADLTGLCDGKPAWSDLLSGTLTLPLICLATHQGWRDRLERILAERTLCAATREEIEHALRQNGCLQGTKRLALEHLGQAVNALHALPASPARRGLSAIVSWTDARLSRVVPDASPTEERTPPVKDLAPDATVP